MKIARVKAGYALFLAQHQIAHRLQPKRLRRARLLICMAFSVPLPTIYGLSTAIGRGMVVTDVKVLQRHGARGKLGGAARSDDFL